MLDLIWILTDGHSDGIHERISKKLILKKSADLEKTMKIFPSKQRVDRLFRTGSDILYKLTHAQLHLSFFENTVDPDQLG